MRYDFKIIKFMENFKKDRMKFATKIIFLSLCIFNIHAELLIVKRTDTGFSPLGAFDQRNYDEIANLLLSYQWPMIISNHSLCRRKFHSSKITNH